jgi:hypothetical protein
MAASPITHNPHYTLCRDQGNPLGYGRNQGMGVLVVGQPHDIPSKRPGQLCHIILVAQGEQD